MQLAADTETFEREYSEVCKQFCDALCGLLSHSRTPDLLKEYLNDAMLNYVSRTVPQSFPDILKQAGELVITAMSAQPEPTVPAPWRQSGDDNVPF